MADIMKVTIYKNGTVSRFKNLRIAITHKDKDITMTITRTTNKIGPTCRTLSACKDKLLLTELYLSPEGLEAVTTALINHYKNFVLVKK